MARRNRLDAELVRRGLARSREQAAALVDAGRVQLRGVPARKAAALVDPADPLLVSEGDQSEEYVSRGGHKLAGALAAFAPGGLTVAGRRCLDAGASTGGFTDVLLRADAPRWSRRRRVRPAGLALRTDSRVLFLERTNVRTLTRRSRRSGRAHRRGPVLHLTAVGPARAGQLTPPTVTWPDGQAQFEVVGSGSAPAGWCGSALRTEAVRTCRCGRALGLGCDVAASPLRAERQGRFFVWYAGRPAPT